MPLLATNIVISASLRPRVQWALAALPLGLMCLMPAALWWATTARAEAPASGPALLLALTAALLSMLAGYALGWVLNAWISRRVLGWPPAQVRAVYLRSQVPGHWLKTDAVSAQDADARSIATWEAQRRQGALRFIAVRGALAWGGPMFLAMHLLPTALRGVPVTLTAALAHLALWVTAGAAFGAVLWFGSESNARKLRQRVAAAAPRDAAGDRR